MSLRLTYGVKMSEITNNSTGAGFNKGAAICAYVCLFLAMCSGIAGWLFLAIIPAIVFIVMLYKAGDGVSHDHAVYSRNTIFAYIAAIIGIIVVWVAVLALIGSNAADEVQMAGFAGHQGRILRPRRARFYGQKSPVVRDGLNVQLLFSLSPLDHQGIAANR